MQEISFKHKKKCFHCEDRQTLEQVVQRDCGFSILGDTENVTWMQL